MSDVFKPKNYIRDYKKASDAERIEGAWVRPNMPYPLESYAQDTVIVALSASVVYIGENNYGVGACYFGPGHKRNLPIQFEEIENELSDQLVDAAIARAAIQAVGNIKQPGSGTQDQGIVEGINMADVRRVIFKVDSRFMAQLLSKDGRVKMRRPGWTSQLGEKLEDPLWLDAIELALDELETLGLEVLVWRVSEEDNDEAIAVMDGAIWEIDCIEDPDPPSDSDSDEDEDDDMDMDLN